LLTRTTGSGSHHEIRIKAQQNYELNIQNMNC